MRTLKWSLAVAGFVAALICSAFWLRPRVDPPFATLPPGERQLAIYDAFAQAVSANYYNRPFVDAQWPALRDEWRKKAAETRDDVTLYFSVLQQLQQKLPSSHVSALPPAELFPPPGASQTPLLVDRGFELALVRRGGRVRGFVGELRPGTPAVEAGIEPGWGIAELPNGAGPTEIGVFVDHGSPQQRFEFESGAGWDRVDGDEWKTSEAAFAAANMRRVEFRHVPQEPFQALSVLKRDDGVTYIRLGTFEYVQAVDLALEALDKAGDGGVVLDLRINGGGLVDQEQRLLDRLLPANLLVGHRVGANSTTESRTGAGRKYTGPLVVLIGPGTGSAAECLAAALQDHGRARLLGRSTAGAVLTARVWPLPGGGTVAVAYLEYVRASGSRIEGIGVLPDLPIMPTNADVRAGRDPALERALQELRGAGLSVPTAGRPPPG